MAFVSTVKASIKAPLKNNHDPQRFLVQSDKNYFGPLAPCLEKRLRIGMQLRPFTVGHTTAELQQAEGKV